MIKEPLMATATIDGLEVSYVVKGSGPALILPGDDPAHAASGAFYRASCCRSRSSGR